MAGALGINEDKFRSSIAPHLQPHDAISSAEDAPEAPEAAPEAHNP